MKWTVGEKLMLFVTVAIWIVIIAAVAFILWLRSQGLNLEIGPLF